MTKEYLIKHHVLETDLQKMTDPARGGWDIQYMQFMTDGKLNVVFVRDCAPPVAAPAAATAKRIPASMQQIVIVETPAVRTLAHFPPVGRIHQAAQDEWNRRYIQALDEGIAMVSKASQSFTKHMGATND